MLIDHDFESIFPLKVDSITIGGTGYPGAVNLPSGTTATRTTSPVAGSIRWNTTLGLLEYYNGSVWSSPFSLVPQPAATVLAAPVGASGVPTFRLQGLGEHSDVTLTSPSSTQVLSYNGSQWVNSSVLAGNAAGLVGIGYQAPGTPWSQVGSTDRYYADFVHNLGTQNVVVSVYDSIDNSIVIPDLTTALNATTVRVQARGNTKTLKVVVVANGASIVAGGSTPSSIILAHNGVTVGTTTTKLNFVGSTVVADSGGGTTTVSIGARFTNYANSFDTPNNADWAVNSFAPTVTDPTYNSMNVRQFSSTVAQGIGFMATIPNGCTIVNFRIRGRSAAAPASPNVVQFALYFRGIPNNGTIGPWIGPLDMNNIPIPTNGNFQYFMQSAPLAMVGLQTSLTYQFELVRKVTGITGTNYPGNFLLAETTFEFA